MKRRVFTGLVTKRPAKEVPLKANEPADIASCILQDLSAGGSFNPTITVPQSDDAMSNRVRELLLYDAALTPGDMPGAYGIPQWALDLARIARANNVAEGITPPQYSDRAYDAVQKARQNTSKQVTAAYAKLDLLTKGGTDQNLSKNDVNLSSIRSWEDVVNAARCIAEEDGFSEQPKYNPGKGKGGNEEGEEEGESQVFESDESEQIQIQPSGDGTPVFDPWHKGSEPKPKKGDPRWGKLVTGVNADKLAMISFRKKGTYKRRAEIEGCVPVNWHRLVTDEKLFRGAPMRKGPKGRGTILVDMSGSMSWSYEDFKNLLEVVPECSVYGYSGLTDDLKTGRLVLLADRGMSAKMDAVETWQYRHNTGANVVDGPALAFLACMTSPRIWLSDGLVTGLGESTRCELYAQAAAICESANIKRIRYANEARDVFLGKSNGRRIAGSRQAAVDVR